MIRIVAARKALIAGAAGAAAFEVLLRPLLLASVPTADLVRQLGTLVFPEASPLLWWPAGLALHLAVGGAWAVVYAYAFFSTFRWPALVQGMVFALLPAVLAVLVMYPQLELMHAPALVARETAWSLLREVSWAERAGLLAGHLVFGAVMGVLYVRPVGYAAGKAPKALAAPRPLRSAGRAPRAPSAFIFATGVECSYPRIQGGRWRRDLMQATGHYRQWPRDLELAARMGVSHLRYGPPLHLTAPDRGVYDWSWSDGPMAAMREVGLEPIVDLCHFGLPDWLESFQNPEVPDALCRYAAAFAKRYPWVRFYTPVNEMYVCARLSALEGLWNEQLRDEDAFARAAVCLARASLSMMDAILERREDAVFVTSESGEFYQAASPDPQIVGIAALENERRFLPLDLIYGHKPSKLMVNHLAAHGVGSDVLNAFRRHRAPKRLVLGVDYYEWNEKLVDTQGRARSLGELFGWYVIASQYWRRYRRPMMHTETNHLDAREAPRWLWRQWHNVQLIRAAGVPVVGFTWYSLTDQVDWDMALAEPLGNVNPVGLFDLNRDPRPVAESYRRLIETYGHEPGLAECPGLQEVLA